MRAIEIYPSSWYYNACVHGFLEILSWGLGEEGERIVEEEILQNDGRAVIPSELAEAVFSSSNIPMSDGYTERPLSTELGELKRIARWWIEVSKKEKGATLLDTCKSYFGSNKTYYPNLLSHNSKISRIDFLNWWFNNEKPCGDTKIRCSFCGQAFSPDIDGRIYDNYFTMSLSAKLGSSPANFPNLFWDAKPNLPVCNVCRSYFLCFHITESKRFFINSDSFYVNWHLNRLVTDKIKGEGAFRQRALLDAMRYDPQLRRGVSSWGLQNLEILLFRGDSINYYPISAGFAKLLLIPKISGLVGRINNDMVWDYVIREHFDYLPTIIYKSLRVYLTRSNSGGDPEVISTDAQGIQSIINIIELFNEIRKNLPHGKGGQGMNAINAKELSSTATRAPLKLDDNLVFRLLELTRLNRKADVYHLLLRTYVANEMEFPTTLTHLFTIPDDELFKTGIYAFISGLQPKEKIKK